MKDWMAACWPVGSETGALLQTTDWAASPLGATEQWPAPLCTLVGVMLGSDQPAFIAWGRDRALLYNDAYARLCGTRHPRAFGQPFARVWADILDDVGPIMDRAFAGQSVRIDDITLLTDERPGRHEGMRFSFSYTPIRDERGVAGVFCVCTETTAQLLAQRENARLLASSRDTTRTLQQWFEQAPGFVALMRGPDHVFEMVNKAYYQLVGHREVIGRPVFEVLPDVREGFEQVLDRVLATGEPFVGHGLRMLVQREPDAPLSEVYVDLVFQPIREPDGSLSGIFVQGHDVTSHVRVVDALRESERRLNAVLDNASVAIFLMDERQQCSYMNAAAEQLTGYTLAETQGKPLHDVVHHTRPDGSHYPLEECPIDRAFPENNQEQGEETFVHKDGSFYPVAFTASPIRDERAYTVGTIIEVRDIRVEKQALEALREADRRKDEFLAMLAHELRNPLAPLTNALTLLERTVALPESGGAMLSMAERQTRQLTRLVDDLLEISRITRGKIELRCEPVSVQAAVRDATESLAPRIQQRRQRLEVRMPDQSSLIEADPARIAQVLENLLTNASKYTPEGGLIRIEVDNRPADVEIRIADNGIGIEPANLPKLFDLFSQLDATFDRTHGGLGIGLALVKRLVELHGGQVGADSAGRGMGATFTVRLPRSGPAPSTR